MFFLCLCFMAFYGNALKNTMSQTWYYTRLSRTRCSRRTLCVSLGEEPICWKAMEETENVANISSGCLHQRDMVCFCCMALCENTQNQTGNNTHLSCARCSLRPLCVSLIGESICWKSMKEIENGANLSPARLHQGDMICFCCMALYENTLNQTGNNTHLSCARCSLRPLFVSLCWESIC